MADSDPIDAMAPWTIKSVSTATRNAVNAAAKREGLTVGQWLERRVREWEADGGPVPVAAAPSEAMTMTEIGEALTVATAAAAIAGVPVPSTVGRDAIALVRARLREGRGKLSLQPRQTKTIEGPGTKAIAGPDDAA